jgi:hypothetical protein
VLLLITLSENLKRLFVLQVTASQHADRESLQEARERIEQGLDSMNQETSR